MDRNPFRFGALALDEAFTDRKRELKELAADIVNGQDVVIVAPRRYGKSSLVFEAARRVKRKKVLFAYVDLSTTPTKEKLAEKLARTIHEDIASPLERARDRALEFFRGLRVQPTVTLDPNDASVRFGFDVGHRPEDVDATIEELLALPGRIAAERERTVALVLDEFQEITEIDPHYPRLLHAVFQTQPEVAHVYLGSKRHLMQRIFNDENEPFWRSAKQMEIGPIPGDDFAAFISARFEASGKRIEADGVSAILELTGGHPYATQQLCYFAWEETGVRRAADRADVGRALERLVDSEHNHFALLWDEATRNERLLLLALAAEPGHPFSAEYRRRHRLPPATNVQRSLASLRRHELAAKDGEGVYSIAEPFLAAWIARTQD